MLAGDRTKLQGRVILFPGTTLLHINGTDLWEERDDDPERENYFESSVRTLF